MFLLLFITFVKQKQFTMINLEGFIKRLKKIIEYYELSSSGFADKIGVQRSSISHLLSGRNKPSLDFILKILKEFPEVELYWLLNGKGNFPKSQTKLAINNPTLELENIVVATKNKEEKVITEATLEKNTTSTPSSISKEIERIVIFYTDGTFKNYHP